MLNWAGIEESMRVKLWTYVVNNATQHDVILTTRYRSRNPYKLFYGDQPKYISNLAGHQAYLFMKASPRLLNGI